MTQLLAGGAGAALVGRGGGGAEAAARGQAPADAPRAARAFRGEHQPEPLPFDPAKLYGAAAAKYVDAFMTNVNWEEVNRRFVGARKMAVLI